LSALGDLFAGLRQVLTLDHRVAELAREVADLKRREEDMRDRLIRLETIIDEARRASVARRLRDS
jgi:hypothetical protein